MFVLNVLNSFLHGVGVDVIENILRTGKSKGNKFVKILNAMAVRLSLFLNRSDCAHQNYFDALQNYFGTEHGCGYRLPGKQRISTSRCQPSETSSKRSLIRAIRMWARVNYLFHCWCDCRWEYSSVPVHDACKRVERAWRGRYVSCINANGTHLFVFSNVRGMSHIETANSPFNCESPWAAIRARAMSQPVRLHTTLTALFACYWLNCLLFQSHTCCDWCISKRGMGHRYVSPSVQVAYYSSKTHIHKHTTQHTPLFNTYCKYVSHLYLAT